MKTLPNKRNATSSYSAGNVSAQELELAIRTATELQGTVFAWLKQNYRDLLKGQTK